MQQILTYMLILGLIKLLFMLKVKTQHIFITLNLNIFLTVLKCLEVIKFLMQIFI